MTIGMGMKRIEDKKLITGKGQYVGDINMADQCEAVIVRSQHAHAKILFIDTRNAEQLPGVLDIFTAADLPENLPPIPMRLSPEESLNNALQYPLANDKVRYAGEPIAVVIAKNRYIAEDAADLISIQYEPLPAITDAHQSVKSKTPLLHEEIGSNDLFIIHSKKGNMEETLKECPYVLEEDLYVQRHTGVPLEPRGLIAVCDKEDHLTVYGAAKVIHFNRHILATLLGMDMGKIRLVENDVGGAFGVRGEFYPEDYLIPFAALKLGKPVKWVEDRLEHMKATNHSREQKHHVKLGFDHTGKIHAFLDDIYVDTGAYIRTHGITVPELTQGMIPGPYDFRAIEINTHVVATNKTPVGTYRGPGRFEGNFVRERMIDIVAKKLKMNPDIVRERNLISKDQMPYTNGIYALGQQVEFDSGQYCALLQKAKARVDWDHFQKRKKQGEAKGKLIGHGMAMFVEKSGLGPWEFSEVGIDNQRKWYCKTGLADVGQGVKTMLAQVCSEQLGIPYNKFKIIHGDTDQVEKGNGSFATRGTVVGGNAAWEAAKVLKAKLLKVASVHLNVAVNELDFQQEKIINRDNKKTLLDLEELVDICDEQGIQLREKYTFSTDHMNYPYGVHAAEVEIDPNTGKVTIVNYHISYDLGRAINPNLVHGQLVGGMAQGLGGTMYEELKYDDAGQLVTGTFMDYLLPTSEEIPEVSIEILEDAPSPLNELGVKGAGEGGAVAVAPAIVNAIEDALNNDSIHLTSLPVRTEKIRSIIKDAEKTSWEV